MLVKSSALLIVACGALVLAAGTAHGDQISVIAVKDNTLYQDAGGLLSAGASPNFFAGRTAQGGDIDIRRGLLQFDVSAIPAGSTVNSVTLSLYMDRTRSPAHEVTLHRALASWGEAGSSGGGSGGTGSAAQPGDATWLHRFYPNTFWTMAGGDFVSVSSAMTLVNDTGPYTWSAPGMVTDVQSWVDDPVSNAGWIVKGDESTLPTSKRFASRTATNTSRRPRLVVDFTPPATTGACCMQGSHCEVTTSEACAAAAGVYMGPGTTCEPSPCAPTGACCLTSGCELMTEANCLAQMGTYNGNGTNCSPDPCGGALGACCMHGMCEVLPALDCVMAGGMYLGDGTNCTGSPCTLVLEAFVDPLPRPAMAQPSSGVPGGVATYEIAKREVDQQLHRDLPPTRVWGYAGQFPGPTIEARRDRPVTVRWINDLRDEMGMLRTEHYLAVDQCLNGPHMHGSTPRTVAHLHGGHVPASVDGYPEHTILPGEEVVYEYPNNQQAATLWYHDHAMGITRLNVYMGLAGFYLIRDDVEDALGLPSGEYEIPLAIQDRSFRPDGSLFYPALWQDHFYGDKILVNGKVWPYLNVRQGKYRFRMLNGSNSRVYSLSLSNDAMFKVIGTEGGLLPAPVEMMTMTLTPGERIDVVIDFASYPAGTEIELVNSAPAPFPGVPGVGVVPDVMRFVVMGEPGFTGGIPQNLRPVVPIPAHTATEERRFIMRKHPEPCAGSRWLIDGLGWEDITEYPRLDTTEIWSFVNRSGDTHPMHMHLVHFQVLDRQAFEVVNEEIVPIGPRMMPPAHEQGWKDTVACNPMEITRVIARFENYTGKFAYHCHILEHEDHEMMRQFQTTCYANCDASTVEPVLNVDDFTCFINMYAAGNPYANCDGSTIEPILNVDDFTCFINRYAAGCE